MRRRLTRVINTKNPKAPKLKVTLLLSDDELLALIRGSVLVTRVRNETGHRQVYLRNEDGQQVVIELRKVAI